jgi:hypothetical protein
MSYTIDDVEVDEFGNSIQVYEGGILLFSVPRVEGFQGSLLVIAALVGYNAGIECGKRIGRETIKFSLRELLGVNDEINRIVTEGERS